MPGRAPPPFAPQIPCSIISDMGFPDSSRVLSFFLHAFGSREVGGSVTAAPPQVLRVFIKLRGFARRTSAAGEGFVRHMIILHLSVCLFVCLFARNVVCPARVALMARTDFAPPPDATLTSLGSGPSFACRSGVHLRVTPIVCLEEEHLRSSPIDPPPPPAPSPMGM